MRAHNTEQVFYILGKFMLENLSMSEPALGILELCSTISETNVFMYHTDFLNYTAQPKRTINLLILHKVELQHIIIDLSFRLNILIFDNTKDFSNK